jgi:outer membrane protein
VTQGFAAIARGIVAAKAIGTFVVAGRALALPAFVALAISSPAHAQSLADTALAADAAGVLAGLPPPRPITLDEAVEMAKRNNPRAVAARGESRTSAARVRSSYASFLPSLSISAGAVRQIPSEAESRIEDGQVVLLPAAPWSYSTGVGANIELFDGGRRFFEISEARAGVRLAEAGLVAQEFDVALEAKAEYFNVLAARESEIAALAQLEQARQQFAAASVRVRAGSGTKSDSLRSEITVRDASVALLTARNDLDLSNASLTRVIGAPHLVTAAETDPLESVTLALGDEELRQLAIEGPAVLQAAARLDAAHAARRISRTSYLPSLNAGWSYGGSGIDSEFGLGDDPWSYRGSWRFSMSYPLFDRLTREEQVVRADVAADNAEADYRDTQLAARQSLVQFLGAFRTAEQRVAAQAASVEAAEEDLRVQRERYALGATTLVELLASQTLLNNARQALIRARYDQRIAKAQLEALVGRSL